MKKSIGVLGLGKYGASLAETLYDLGQDVLIADHDEKTVRDMASKVTSAVCADLENEDEILALGLQNLDVVITCMSSNIAASIMCVTIAKEKGVPVVIAKASSPRMINLLTRLGADKIIFPEKEGGIRSAMILASQFIQDYFELDENLCMIELQPKKNWIGKNLIELDLRRKYNMNVAAIKNKGGYWGYVNPSQKLKEENLLMIIVEKNDIKRIQRLE
ncbi:MULTISPECIES: potassium channel family protein [unclassified Butyrivibrio]|uniref:potassium channel family protein n=1 Tax=unclassified Butyrivibrio TaxID=2639466 RepID=UPI00042A6785|nr:MULTISPECIES: TrkA family potassium uptake protein [unclassified Butyrivibrio]